MHRRTMWELVLRSCLRRTRAPEVRPSSDNVNITNHQGEMIDSQLFPEGTCASCQNIALRNIAYDSANQHLYLHPYNRNVPTKCTMCKIIFNSIYYGNEINGFASLRLRTKALGPRENELTSRDIYYEVEIEQQQEVYPWKWEFKDHGDRFRIYAEPGSYASTFVRSRRSPLSNLSDITFQRITRWIKDCDETHLDCGDHASQSSDPEFRYLPTRVVHVGSATQQPHIHVSGKHQNDRYIALSHCWGRSVPARTLEGNIEQYKNEIIFERLSKTFQDALRVTRQLGIEYIWIDSLCIVQDDKDDWLRESQRMGSVYANAYLTLAATSATDGSGGLNSVRPESNWTKFPCDGTDRTKGYVWYTDASWESYNDIDYAPLNSRGWVFQERILSRRIIHFAASQVYWECKQRFFGEECEDESGFLGATLQLPRFWANVNAISNGRTTPLTCVDDIRNTGTSGSQLDEFYGNWRTLVDHYVRKHFTKQIDRLVALQGIIRVVEEQTGLRCFDGHWEDGPRNFLRALMWLPYEQRTLSVLDEGRRSRLCSSWSWASLEGPIDHYSLTAYSWENLGLKNCDLRLEAIEEKIHVPWPTHPLKVSGMLQIVYRCQCRGDDYTYPPRNHHGVRPLLQCECREREYATQRIGYYRTFLLKVEKHGSACGWICFDRENEEPEQFYISPVHVGSLEFNARQCIACLALVERHGPESSERWFERVGAGYIEMVGDDDYTYARPDLFEACERSTYYIV